MSPSQAEADQFAVGRCRVAFRLAGTGVVGLVLVVPRVAKATKPTEPHAHTCGLWAGDGTGEPGWR